MFIGRERELANLLKLKEKDSASLVAITGRRRIGKSRLLDEFSENFKKSYVFTGLAPSPGVGVSEQKAEFSRILGSYFNWPEFNQTNWAKLFSLLAKQTSKGEVLIILDEISWMAKNDDLFLPQLKNAWDNEFKKNDKLILAVCGSASSWIERNILSSTGFVGRVSETLKLKELPIESVSKFWGKLENKISAFEKIKILNITGAIPRYLEEILPADSAEQNINRLCFSESGFLFNEFHRLFSDLFAEKQEDYRIILEALGVVNLVQSELAKKLKSSSGGTLTQRLNELESLGFIARDYSWDIAKAKLGKLSKYRIVDNYTRFFLRYILPNVSRIKNGGFPDKGLEFLPSWNIVTGLQFENLVLNNRRRLFDLLDFDPRDVIQDGPYFQQKNNKQKGCQIDYLIQLRFNSLYLCEIKAQSKEVSLEVIKEIEEKIKRLNLAKRFSLRPVLVSAGPVSEQLKQSRYFAKIVTGEDLLE